MIVNIPRSDQALMKMTARTPNWSHHQFVGRPFRVWEVAIPTGIVPEDVEIIAEPCNRQGETIETPIVIREAIKKPVQKIVVETPIEIDLPMKGKKKRFKQNREIVPTFENEDGSPSQGCAADNDLG